MSRSPRSIAAGIALLAVLAIRGSAQQPPAGQPPAQSQPAQQPPAQQPPAQSQPAQQPPAQQPPAQPADQPQPPVFRGGINFVRVDVIVSDNKTGAQVADL